MTDDRTNPAPALPRGPPGAGRGGPDTAGAESPRAVTLDLWHTLIYLAPAAEEEYMQRQRALALEVLRSAAVDPGAPELDDPALLRAFVTEYTRAVAEAQYGRTVTPAGQIVRAAAAVRRSVDVASYLARLHALVGETPFLPAPGVDEFLARLSGQGFRTAIISNTTGEPGASIRPVLRKLGLDGRFNAMVFSDERPWTKPAPEIFEDALRLLGSVRGRAVHVGDGWSDIEGAHRAGLRAGVLYTGLQEYGEAYRKLFLPPNWSNPPSPYRVDRLDELPALLNELLPEGR